MRRCRRQAPAFSGSAPTTFRLYRYSNEGRPSDSGRNSYVSSNYSNFLSQNSQRKLPRSSPHRRKRNRRLRPPRGDLRPRQTTPSPILSHPFPIRSLGESSSLSLSAFPVRKGRSRKANAQVPSPLFPFVEFHPLRRDRRVGTTSEHARRSRETPCKIANIKLVKTKQRWRLRK